MTQIPSYPKQCFIQLGFGDMPSYAPVESIWNDPLEMYDNFISNDQAELEADILDTLAEYRQQIQAGERDEGDAPDPERISACTLFADASIQIGDRVITQSAILKHFGIDHDTA